MNIRPRRNRKSSAIRHMVEETKLGVENLIYPIFLKDGKKMWEGNSTNMMSNTVPELQEFLSTKLI